MERKLTVASGASPAGVATMWAVVQRSYGPPSAPESSEMAIPVPGPGDVLVQVSAASVHPGDCFVVTGSRTSRAWRMGSVGRAMRSPGWIFRAWWQRSGRMSPTFAPATRCSGGAPLAHHACVPADSLVPVPANLSVVHAAARPHPPDRQGARCPDSPVSR